MPIRILVLSYSDRVLIALPHYAYGYLLSMLTIASMVCLSLYPSCAYAYQLIVHTIISVP